MRASVKEKNKMRAKHFNFLFDLMEEKIKNLEYNNQKQLEEIAQLKDEISALDWALKEQRKQCGECQKIEF